VNLLSALSTAMTIMLTYLIIVRLIKQWRGEPKDGGDIFVLVASGLIGALSFAFTDTLWFNAVEAEVYAISMLFTSAIVYFILVWLEKSEQKGSERYLLIIAYLTGLAIGVHLLMILALPALALIVYFKRLDSRREKISLNNLVIFGLITLGVFLVIYPGVVQYIPWLAGHVGLWSLAVVFLLVLFGAYMAITSNHRLLSLAFMGLILIMVGYSTYALIYIRSGLDPVIDENDPETPAQMVKYLNREQYGTWGTFPRRFQGLPMEWQFKQQYPNRSYATYQWGKQMDFLWNYQIVKMYIRYFGWQFIGKGTTLGPDGYIVENITAKGLYALPFLIGLLGMIYHFKRDWRHASSVLALFILTGVAIVIYLNQEDPQPRERDYVFIGSFFAFALWIGIGASAILEWIKDKFYNPLLRKDATVAPNAGSGKSNTMFYALSGAAVLLLLVILPLNLIAHNFESHDRTGNYVAYDYSYNILQSCEPDAILFTNGDNDTFPLWFLQYVYNIRPDVRVVNLSLLNTNWYIKQLKHQEPKVPITLSDAQIDQLDLIPWETQRLKIPVPPRVRSEALDEITSLGGRYALEERDMRSELEVEVKPTIFERALRVQDFMILNIIYANQWRKPINFAVTVSDDNKVNLENWLRMDGLTFKLVPVEGDILASKLIQKNLFEVFKYRGLDDPTVHYDDNVEGLLQNYRAAFLRLAQEYMITQEKDKVVMVLDKMEEVIPESVIPAPDYRLSLRIGQLYDMAGKPEELIKRGEAIVAKQPDNAMAYGYLVATLSRNGKHERAVELLEDWIKRHPDDREAQQRLDEERELAGNTTEPND
ncbi:DUF2723 domain-containing protein, partial [candidate division KSB1 bacterium]|nr:DUF2723 domain-containing protein [candidate division KSB1 bacterium]